MREPESVTTSDLASSTKRILLLGESGSGKTRFLHTMPKPFIADFDNGMESIIGLPEQDRKDVKYLSFPPTAAGFKEFQEVVKLWCTKGPQWGCETFCLDSLSFMSEAAFAYTAAKNPGKSFFTQAEWGEMFREIQNIIADLCSAQKFNVVVTAHWEADKDELTGSVRWLPLMYGRKLPPKVPSYFNEVWSTRVEMTTAGGEPKATYVLQVVPDSKFKIVKSGMNVGGVFKAFESPDFKQLVTKATKKKG